MADAYEVISGIIGEEMDRAWKKVISRAAQATTGEAQFTLDGGLGESLDVDDLKQWALNLWRARLTGEFLPRITRPASIQCHPFDEVDVSALHAAGDSQLLRLEGRINIGAEIRF